jgi:DNA-directed RNA polymerase beta' subunit
MGKRVDFSARTVITGDPQLRYASMYIYASSY